MFSFLLTESPWELSCVCDIDRLRVVSDAWLHFSILTPGLPPPHYDRSVTQVTSSDTWHTLTFPAFIHWPFPDCNLKYCPIFAASHVSVLLRAPETRITRSQYRVKFFLVFCQETKSIFYSDRFREKNHKTWSLKVLLQQNSRIFWYEVSQRLALLHEILTRNINFGQF